MHTLDAPHPPSVAPSLPQDAHQDAPRDDVTAPAHSTPSLALRLRGVETLIGERIARGITSLLNDFDITPERWRVLAALAVEPDQTMTQLSRVAVLPPASLTRHVDRLVARGLVARTVTPEDRRRVTAALTEEGAQAWKQVEARENEVLAELRTLAGGDRFDQMISELDRLLGLLTS